MASQSLSLVSCSLVLFESFRDLLIGINPVLVKDVDGGEVPDVAPVLEATESSTAPLEETPAEPEPEVENKTESADVEPPVAEPVEVDATSDSKDVEPLQTKETPERVPEEPTKVGEPVVELDAAPTVELKVWNGVPDTRLD